MVEKIVVSKLLVLLVTLGVVTALLSTNFDFGTNEVDFSVNAPSDQT